MSGIDITINIYFNSGIHGNHSNTANYFRTVGNFRRTQHQFMTEKVHIVINILQTVIRHTQRTGTTKLDSAFFHQFYYRILNYFSIHFKRRNAGVLAQRTQHGIGNISYSRLQGKEGRRNNAPAHVRSQELSHILTDFICHGVRFMETTRLIRHIGFYHASNLGRVYLNIRKANAVARTHDRNRTTIRRTFHFIQIVHAYQAFTVCGIQFHNDFIGQSCNGRRNTHSCSQVNTSVFRNLTSFYDSHTYVPQEAGT